MKDQNYIVKDSFFPNLEKRRTPKRGIGARPLLESEIKDAQSKSRSAFEAARLLEVSYNTYKKYAKLYGIFEDLKNPYGIGIEKAKAIKNKKYHIDDIIDGKHLHYPLHKFKNKLFDIHIVIIKQLLVWKMKMKKGFSQIQKIVELQKEDWVHDL